jgi:hypothetical protein
MLRMSRITVMLLPVLLLAGWQAGPQQSAVSLMPEPDPAAGWKWDFETEVYTPENLFEYINGEAEVYNDYSFIDMATGSHVRIDDAMASVTFDIYDMGTPLNAFGIYSNYRRPGLTFDEIGEEAIVSELNIRFFKGRFFVQLSAGSMDEVVRKAMRDYADRLAGVIRPADRPVELSYLPGEGRAPHTLKYLAKGLLGQAAFERSLQAVYNLPSGDCEAFVVPKENEDDAVEALGQFIQSLQRQGQLTDAYDFSRARQLLTNTEYYGRVMTEVYGRFIVGVVRFSEQSEAAALLNSIKSLLR